MGTAFAGFQDQKGNNVRTVEGELKSALEQNFPCAGRTDKVCLYTDTSSMLRNTLYIVTRMCRRYPK